MSPTRLEGEEAACGSYMSRAAPDRRAGAGPPRPCVSADSGGGVGDEGPAQGRLAEPSVRDLRFRPPSRGATCSVLSHEDPDAWGHSSSGTSQTGNSTWGPGTPNAPPRPCPRPAGPGAPRVDSGATTTLVRDTRAEVCLRRPEFTRAGCGVRTATGRCRRPPGLERGQQRGKCPGRLSV